MSHESKTCYTGRIARAWRAYTRSANHTRRIAAAVIITAAARGWAGRRWCACRRAAIAALHTALCGVDRQALRIALQHGIHQGWLCAREPSLWLGRLDNVEQAVQGLSSACADASAAAAAQHAAACADLGVVPRVIESHMDVLRSRAAQALTDLQTAAAGNGA